MKRGLSVFIFLVMFCVVVLGIVSENEGEILMTMVAIFGYLLVLVT